MKGLPKWMWGWITRPGLRFVHVPPMGKARLLECFHVPVDNDLLQGVLHELRAAEEEARERLEAEDLPGRVANRYVGMMWGMRRMEQRLLDLVGAAQRAAAGQGERPESRRMEKRGG